MPQQCGEFLCLASALGVQKSEKQPVPKLCNQPVRAKKNLSKLRDPNALVTTVMIRGIPCSISQDRMMEILNRAGFTGLYDFFYLPRAGKSGSNLGYAFVNFAD